MKNVPYRALRWDTLFVGIWKISPHQLLFVAFFFLSGSILFSQKPLQFTLPNCPGGTINDLGQDADGLILAGTAKGLYQYDGKVWTPLLPDSVKLVDISCIAHDSMGNCWIGNKAGEIWVRNLQAGWEQFSFGNYLNEAPISGIHFGSEGELWVATYGGGIFYQKERDLVNIRREEGLPDDQVYSMSLDDKGACWAATDAGLAQIHWLQDSMTVRVWTPKDGLSDLMIFAVRTGRDGKVYAAGFEGGVNVYSPESNRFTPMMNDWRFGPVRRLASRPDGRVYAALEDGGLVKVFNEGSHYEYEKGRISSLYMDSEANLWTAFYGGELRRAFTPLEVIPMPNGIEVHAVEVGPEGNIWAGCSEGLCVFDINKQSWENISSPKDIHIISLLRIQKTLWIGTFGQGLFTYDFNSGSFKPFSQNHKLPDKNILAMSMGKPGIFLATLGGLGVISHIKHEVFLPGVEGLPESYIYQAILHHDLDLWVASDGKGLFHGQTFSDTMESIPVFEGKTVYSIYDNGGRIWAATESGELYHQTENGFVPVSTYDAGPFTCLQGDRKGNVLAIGNARCNWYDSEGNFLLGLGEAQGTHAENRNLNASTYDYRGRIWAAAGDRILCVWPLEKQQQIKPRALLREVSVLLQPIDKYTAANLSHDENHLSFLYGASWYQSTDALGYRYRLRGHNMDWVYSSNTNAIFPKLAPGQYTFEVQAGLNDHFEKSETVGFRFRIKKPWWKETWFVTLSIIATSLLILLYLELRERRLKKIARLEQEKISFQLEMLRQQINPHFLFNSLNTLLDMVEEGQQKEAIVYIERLSDLFRSVLTLRDQSVISLKEEIDLANRFYSLQKNRYGDKLDISFGDMPSGKYIPPLTVQLLIENAIKHNEVSRKMPLLIEVFMSETDKLTVRNNLQKRRTPASSTGTGLHNIMSRYEVLTNDAVDVEESEAFFTVMVPLLGMKQANSISSSD